MARLFGHRAGAGTQRRRPFDILTNDKLEAARTENWFLETNLVIDRLVKRSRNEEAVSVSCLIRPGLTPWRRSVQPRIHRVRTS